MMAKTAQNIRVSQPSLHGLSFIMTISGEYLCMTIHGVSHKILLSK